MKNKININFLNIKKTILFFKIIKKSIKFKKNIKSNKILKKLKVKIR